MRFVVTKGRRYVRLVTMKGMDARTLYEISTPDVADAHDFGSRSAAEKWAEKNGGQVDELTDSGHWPVDDLE